MDRGTKNLRPADAVYLLACQASESEVKDHTTELIAASSNIKDFDIKAEKFYKVKWTRVPDLVEKRKVFLKGGMAYVPMKEQSSIVFQEFQKSLEKALEVNPFYIFLLSSILTSS